MGRERISCVALGEGEREEILCLWKLDWREMREASSLGEEDREPLESSSSPTGRGGVVEGKVSPSGPNTLKFFSSTTSLMFS